MRDDREAAAPLDLTCEFLLRRIHVDSRERLVAVADCLVAVAGSLVAVAGSLVAVAGSLAVAVAGSLGAVAGSLVAVAGWFIGAICAFRSKIASRASSRDLSLRSGGAEGVTHGGLECSSGRAVLLERVGAADETSCLGFAD